MAGPPIRIVMVEDDEVFRDLVVGNLSRHGHRVTGVADGSGLYRELLEHPADIVLLDVDLPGDDGFVIARQLRAMQRTRLYGIIMLTALGDQQAHVAGLDSGADGFLVKSAHPATIHAHIQSLYRRMTLSVEVDVTAGLAWRFNKSLWRLTAPSGAEIALTHLEVQLIEKLADSNGRPVKRRDIIQEALQQDPLIYDERRLEAVVSRLRRKIGKAYAVSQPVKVAHSVGYMFADPIVRE